GVVLGKPAVLHVLATTGAVDRAELGKHDDVRSSRIRQRIVEERGQRTAGQYLVRVDIRQRRRSGRSLGLILQPQQGNRVRSLQRQVSWTNVIDDDVGGDLHEFSGIDRHLP